MATILRSYPTLSPESRSIRFEGRDHGSPVSFFLIDTDPGKGSDLHTHPYAETWVLRAGTAEFTIGDEQIVGTAGDIIIAPPNVPHRYINTGTGPLQMVCIHPGDRIVQELV
ncbi:cupin 2 domain-containing protein [Nitratireductor aquibiodomus RA22]|uniref:Cupin 2 domain-containing protein n=1 Tax=Nitratireductor aquibiodomus RA22 TaxID=1189611 RepID=I5BVH7_9HYPH|nr:cupin domain-containing protein [Nitratireductor aquibiodomus]EIM73579.1 cupin 2 domain-containing protein [Nitratireductor aquibiodomus RA22]